MWALWLTGQPASDDPFTKPDAWSGGARTREAALRDAARKAGIPVSEIDSRWAIAWGRVLIGEPPWIKRPVRPVAVAQPRESIWTTLGVADVGGDVSLVELKQAFRQRALQTHPDRGGDADAFMKLKRAYDAAQLRIRSPRRRK